MKKRKDHSMIVKLVLMCLLVSALGGCGKKEAAPETAGNVAAAPAAESVEAAESAENAESADTAKEDQESASPAESEPAETPAAEAESTAEEPETTTAEAGTARADGERFESVIILEGMEEAVKYEHIQNAALGFEMDYEYESFVRQSDPDRECFVSVYDDPENPENYLEVVHSPENADTAAVFISETLSRDYELTREAYELEGAGRCTRIGASEIKGTGQMPDQLQMVYVIPAGESSIIATAHYAIEGAEGFGRRFSYMMHTLSVMDGQPQTGNENTAKDLTEEQALEAVKEYCISNNPDLADMADSEEYTVNWDVSTNDAGEIIVLFRSYTGAETRYYIDPASGETYVTELVPGIIDEEQRTDESFNVRECLLGQ